MGRLGCGRCGVIDEARGGGKSGNKSGASQKGFFEAAKNIDCGSAPDFDELRALLEAHCRHATTELPPGKPGVRWAADFLATLPGACCRRLPDVVTTGPKVFEFLVGQGFFAAMPSPRLVPQVLGLVAGVSPLLQARSSRQWALWLARVHDTGSPLMAAVRKKTPSYQLGVSMPAPAGPPLRATQIRDERDRLAADLAAASAENGRQQVALDEAFDERDRLAVELAIAAERERGAGATADAERDRLAGELRAAVEREREAVSAAAADSALLKQMQDKYDRFAAELAALHVDYERMFKALAGAQETAKQRSAEHELLARVLADEKRTSELLRGELAKLRGEQSERGAPSRSDKEVPDALTAVRQVLAEYQAARHRREQRSAGVGAGKLPGEELLVEADAARRQALAVADALRVENSELRAERDGLRGRCGELESELQARTGTDALEVRVEKAERALVSVRADLAAARRGAEALTERLDRKRILVHSLQKMMEAQEIELAAANAELAQRKSGMTSLILVALAREQAKQTVRDAQARRAPLDED